jgi:hypothetical protein
MGKTLTILVVVLSVVLFFFIQAPNTTHDLAEKRLVDDTLYVVTFTHQDVAKGNILLQVPFLKTNSYTQDISIAIDVNGDSIFSDSEYFIQNYPVTARKNWKSGFYVSGRTVLTDGMPAQVVVNDTSYLLTTEVVRHEVGDLFLFENTIDAESAMKGVPLTFAQENNEEQLQVYVPDTTQKVAECAPTAALNVLLHLLDTNASRANITKSPREIIDELKIHMQWTKKNGVLTENYVKGFSDWALENNIPITIQEIGSAHGDTTFDDIQRALEESAQVNARIKFIDTKSQKVVSGHMVTVIDTYQRNGKRFIDIHDPVTPEGTEVIEIQSNQFTRYSPWEGVTLLSWAFTHTWNN